MARPIAPKVMPYERADGTTSYRVRVRVDGRQTTETFESQAAADVFRLRCMDPNIGPAKAIALRAREDRASDEYVPTLAEMLETHIRRLTGVEQATRDGYRDEARRSWLPTLAPLRVDELTKDDIADWVNAAAGTVAPKTIKNAHSVLSAVMESAIEDGHAPSNPARRTRLPRAGEEDEEEIRFLTHAEFDLLYAQIPEHYRPLVVAMFGTGMRWSEITALQVRDVDLDAGYWEGDTFVSAPLVKVARAWKKSGKLGPPKSRKSKRTIWIGAEVVDVIEPLIADRPASALVFTTPSGGQVRHANFYNRIWKPATVRASMCDKHMPENCRCGSAKPNLCTVHTEKGPKGQHVLIEPCGCAGTMDRPRIHDARHTAASWLIAEGVRLEVIQERLGHEDYATTRRIYGHLMPDMQREAAQAASLAFARTSLANANLRAIG